jgi:hypothetical protein
MADKQAGQNKENTTIKVIILLGVCRYPTLKTGNWNLKT